MAFTGLFGAQAENLKTLLANVSAFRTFVGVSEVVDAAARVNPIMQSADSRTWPLAIIKYGNWSANRDSAGAGVNSYGVDSHLVLMFEKTVDSITAAQVETFVNSISSVIAGMMNLSGTSNYMYIQQINGMDETFFQEEKPEEKVLRAVFTIHWDM